MIEKTWGVVTRQKDMSKIDKNNSESHESERIDHFIYQTFKFDDEYLLFHAQWVIKILTVNASRNRFFFEKENGDATGNHLC